MTLQNHIKPPINIVNNVNQPQRKLVMPKANYPSVNVIN